MTRERIAQRWRHGAFAAAVVALLAICATIGGAAWVQHNPWARVAGFALLVPAGLAVTLRWPRGIGMHTQTWGILLLTLVARLVLLPHPPDSDVNRYLWEGRLIREGQSPYAHIASAPEWELRRDAYWQGMNQKGLRTIYPPVAEWTFAAIGALRYDATALKLLFIAFDLGVVALLIMILAARGQPTWLAGLYAFNPVPLIGFAGEAHFDAMLLFFLLLALWLRERQRPVWSWIAFGLAVQMKLVAIILVPLLLRRGGWRTAWVGGAAVLLPFLPYLADIPAWLAGVRHFGADLAFNGSIHALAWTASSDRPAAAIFCTVLLALWVIGVSLVHGDRWRAAFWIFGGLVVLSPTVHYWYLAWALVFLPLFPSLAWLTLSCVMALYFLVQREVQAGRDWGLPPWAQNAIWLAFGVALLREACIALPALWRRFRQRDLATSVRTFSVVIPTLNEAGNLGGCLQSVARMSPAPSEIIVADAGSIDGTREVATTTGAVVVLAAAGRGHQIASGTNVARGDVVLVLHADAIVCPDTGQRILDALNAASNSCGGAVGQRFNADSPGLVVIEALNDFRALFLGISFGDQGQFFRRALLAGIGGFPGLPLMEDVEFSLRARAAGPTLYLGDGLIASDRRWRTENWLKRCLSVIAMTARYRCNRRNAAQFAAALYKKYYSTAN